MPNGGERKLSVSVGMTQSKKACMNGYSIIAEKNLIGIRYQNILNSQGIDIKHGTLGLCSRKPGTLFSYE
jgi:hypothetical protein